MSHKANFVALVVCLAMAGATVALSATTQRESETSQTAKHDVSKSAINNIRATLKEMRQQEKILHRLTGQPPKARAAYVKLGDIKGESSDAKEGEKPDAALAAKPAEPARVREAASRTECQNNLKQMTLALRKESARLRTYYREENDAEGLKHARRLDAQAKRLHRVAAAVPSRPDPKADKKVVKELGLVLDSLEETVALLIPAVQKVRSVKP